MTTRATGLTALVKSWLALLNDNSGMRSASFLRRARGPPQLRVRAPILFMGRCIRGSGRGVQYGKASGSIPNREDIVHFDLATMQARTVALRRGPRDLMFLFKRSSSGKIGGLGEVGEQGRPGGLPAGELARAGARRGRVDPGEIGEPAEIL